MRKIKCVCCFLLACVLMMNVGIGTAYAVEIENNVQASAAGQSPRERRALLLGRRAIEGIPEANVKEMANLMKKCTYDGKKMKSVVKKMDLSKAQIESAVKETFRDTTWADVSYIYIACHGDGIGNDKPQKILIDKQEKGYTPKELRQLLEKNIKGKVVVLLECCYAGMLLPKSTGAKQNALRVASMADNPAEEFIQEFIGAGSSSGGSIQAAPYGAASDGAKDKFFVLCSSRIDEESFGQMTNSRFSLATKYWLVGGGWNKYLENGLKMRADKNLDKKVTLEELYNYSAPKVFEATEDFTVDGKEVRQNVCAYPQNGKMILFGDF